MAGTPADENSRGEPARRVTDLLAVLEVSRRLAALPELTPLLELIERSALRVLDCERASLFLYDRRTDELYSLVATGDRPMRFAANLGFAGQVFRTGQVVNVPDAYADPRFNPAIDRQTGFRTRSILTCPLSGWDNTTVGVLQVLNKRTGPFDAWDEVLAQTFGAQAGVAIQRQLLLEEYERKQHFARAMDLARQIQQGLLPEQPPRAVGFDIAGWSQPADETGGDFFDFRELAGGDLAVTVADASGHGIGAALVVAECRALLRATLAADEPLDRVVARVNRLLCDDLANGWFVTAFLGLLSAASGRLGYVSAGHGPVLFFERAGGTVQELSVQGIPLGVLPDAPFGPPGSVAFAPGDFVAIVTDGVFEWADARGECFGVGRLRERIRRDRDLPAAEIIRNLHRAVLDFAGDRSQPDDLTAVVIKKL
ncbi:MAG TPA: GAF domain-containing SpoIIE family protein phosphatase [Isosphaeraceae bacterium]|jgi:phosphoserine phosphatase